MKKIISLINNKLAHGGFARNVIIMFTGTALGQLTSLLLSPVLTRIYSPDLFGMLGLFSSLVAILSVIASMRYEMAMTIVKNDKEAANLLAVCCSILFTTTCIFYLVLFLFPHELKISIINYSEFTKSVYESLKTYWYLLPIGFFGIGAYQIMVSYATLAGAFGVISKTKIYQGVTGPVSQIIMGIAGAGGFGLIIGFILGQSAGFLNILWKLIIKPKTIIQQISYVDMKKIARRYIRFPLLSTWSALISAIGSNNILLLLIPIIYSHTVAGFIFLTDRIIGRPLLLISTSILQVYLGEASKTQDSDPVAMRKRFLQITGGQFVIVSFWLIIINLTASFIIPFVFGEEWKEAVIYIHVMSICYLPQMIVTSVVHTLQILEKQGLMAMWDLSRFICVISGFIISYEYSLEPQQAVLIYCVTQALFQVILFGLMYISIQKLQPKKL
ncbi:MAG: oligosaccharide flippase family protein [Rickettsiales bacterium]